MPSNKPKPNDIAESPLGPLALKVFDRSKVWSLLAKQVEDCFVFANATPNAQLDPFKVALLLPQLQLHFRTTNDPPDADLSALQAWTNQECRRAIAEFEVALQKLCAAEKLQVEGRFPHFILAGFLEIIVQDKQPVCKIGGSSLNTVNLSIVAPVILQRIREDTARKFDPKLFLDQLYKAYQRTALNGRIPGGEPVLAKLILPEIAFIKQSLAFLKSPSKAAFVDYTLEHFARDLALILKDGNVCTSNGKRLHPTPVSNSSDGIPVMIDGAYRYIGRLTFLEETQR
ncbi:MAG TPA: hypothetical protein VGO67_04790 [Verrucomicrobiae bacterium]|jgi:hypothetical protein